MSTRRRRPRYSSRKHEPGERRGQARGEGEHVAVIAHAAEPGDRDEPGAGQRGEVQAVGGVARQIVQVDRAPSRGSSRRRASRCPTSAATIAWIDADSDESRTVMAS